MTSSSDGDGDDLAEAAQQLRAPVLSQEDFPDEMFDDVDLFTMDGHYVTTGQITRTLVPNAPRYKLIMWGSRTFVWDDQHQQYRETIGTAVMRAYMNADPDRGK